MSVPLCTLNIRCLVGTRATAALAARVAELTSPTSALAFDALATTAAATTTTGGGGGGVTINSSDRALGRYEYWSL